MAQTLVFGFIQGGIYALIAAGIVLVYKGSRVLNFAQAEIGTLALYVTWEVSGARALRLPWAVGAFAGIVFAVGVGLAFERFAVRRMGDAQRVTVAVATIGLLSLSLAIEGQIFGPSPRILPPPVKGLGVTVAGVIVNPAAILSVIVVAIIAVALTQLLRRTDFGLGVLASAQDSTAARLMGVSQRRVSAFIWGTAGALSAIAALLILPATNQPLAPGALAGLFIGGLTAALVGGLESLSGAFVGGFIVGIVEALIKFKVPDLKPVGMFAVIVAMLLFRPQGLLGGRRA